MAGTGGSSGTDGRIWWQGRADLVAGTGGSSGTGRADLVAGTGGSSEILSFKFCCCDKRVHF